MKVGQSGEVGAAGASATPRRDFSDDAAAWSPARSGQDVRSISGGAACAGLQAMGILEDDAIKSPRERAIFCWLGTLTHCLTVMIKLIVGLPTRGIGRFDPPGDAQHYPTVNRDKDVSVQ
jgi:hypothetical protein